MTSHLDDDSSVASDSPPESIAEAEMLEDVLELSNDAIVWLDSAGRIARANDQMVSLSGRSRRDLLGAQVAELAASPGELDEIPNWRTGDTYEGLIELNCPGGIRITQFRGRASENYRVLILSDLTERLEARSAVESAEMRLEAVLASAPLVMVATDLDGRIKLWRGMPLDDVDPEQAVGESILTILAHLDVFDDGDLVDRRNVLERVREGDAHNYTIVGRERDFAARFVPTREDGESIDGMLGIAIDVTEQRLTERRLAVASETLSRLVEAAPVAIDSLDLDANVQFWNPAAEELFGWSADEVVGGPPPGVSERGLEKIREEVRQARSLSRKSVRRETRDGRMLELSLSSAPLTDENGELVGSVGIMVDETDKKATAEALNQSQKMEAVGRLAGAVAHDFNNMLSVIMGFSRLVHAELDDDSSIREDVGEIITAAERANRLTEQLLTFSRRRLTKREVLDLHKHLAKMQRMVERLVGEDVVVRTDFAAARSTVAVDASHLEQVVMNLIINARDAMPDGGKLNLTTAVIAKEDCPNPACSRPCVAFVVRDNGIGMSDETRKKVFDPFFTTKTDGSGIGLSTVYGILKQHDAHVDIRSKVGVGTVIRIFFPLAEAVDLTAEESSTTLETLTPTSGEILVVDDERAVRDYVEKVFSRNGYQVVAASNAGEAYLLCDAEPERFQVVLTDMVMPRVDGVSLHRRLETVAPATEVLFMSGFPPSTGSDMHNDIAFLHKPFTPDELLAFVGRALDGRDS